MSDYIYQEYPKWVSIGEAKPQLFDTADDEKAARGDDTDSLKAQAEKLGLQVDARWGAKRLQAELDKAK